MKRKFAYGLLGVGVVLLIAVIALVVQTLLRLSMLESSDADFADDQDAPFRRPRAEGEVAGTAKSEVTPTARERTRKVIPAPTQSEPAATASIPPETASATGTPSTPRVEPAAAPPAPGVQPPAPPAIKRPGAQPPKPKLALEKGAVGTIATLSGTATAFYYEGAEERSRILRVGGSVFLNEVIETMENTRLRIEFPDGTSIAQGPESIIQIESYLFDEESKPKNNFTMRLTRGLCKLITGAITDLNPERFKIRTRLATIGIRGTQLLLKSDHRQSDTYVIDLSPDRRVHVDATRDGREILDVHSGESIKIADGDKDSIEVDRRGVLISVIEGQGIEHERFDPAEARALLDTLAMRPAASYDLFQTPNVSTIELHRKRRQPGDDGGREP